MTERIIIIGGGQAGLQAAVSLRQEGFGGRVTLYAAEDCLPYQRPPLSKAYLKGDLEEERLYFRPREFFESQRVDLHLGVEVARLDPVAREIELADGAVDAYDKLLLATGAPPRRLALPGVDLPGVHYLRTLKDSAALTPVLESDGRIVIVGAGYIGLEVAAVMRARGKNVTVLEMADRVLARVGSLQISSFYEQLHREEGVDLRLGAAFKSVHGAKTVEAVELQSGEVIGCSHVLVGVGANPEVGLAADSGLDVENGVVVDDHARTSDPHIWAAGDCANFPSHRYGRRIRFESVPNAIEQAKAAAANMAGGDIVYDPLPWFWSDQYDVKLQTVGLFEGCDEIIVRGKPEQRKFSVWYLRTGELLAVDAINDPASFAMGKMALAKGRSIDAERLPDVDVSLREILK